MNILITSASRKVSLVEIFKSAFKKEGGGEVVAGDASLMSAALFFADRPCLLPADYDKNFIEKIIKICRDNKIKLIVPTRDEELLIFSKNKERLEQAGVKVSVASEDIIRTCQDKLKFFQFCKKNGFDFPKIYSFSDIENKKAKFPLFLNNRFSKASKKAFKINSKKELNAYLKLCEEPVIQEYIEAKEYTIDLFSDFDGKVITAVPRERIKIFGGESFVSKTYKNKKIIEETAKIAGKLKLVGHNTIQCFFDEKTVKFIEINPRYGGGVNLSVKAGADTARFLIKIMKGKKIKPRIGEFKNNLTMLRYTKDFFYQEEKIKWKRKKK